jgi:two-component system, LytTR family, response regulator
MRAFLVDDEPLALKRLARLLEANRYVEIVGTSTDPLEAVTAIQKARPDVVFLDIQMPEMTGFDVLAKLDPQPLVIFTTAHDQFALKAFEVNSIDYLLKPIEAPKLQRALRKLERIQAGAEARPEVQKLLDQIAATLHKKSSTYLERLPSRMGERIELVEVARVTHFFAGDKLTYAATPAKNYVVDFTIQQLEEKLDPQQFVRIHRATIVAIRYIHELYPWFAGRMKLRLKDERHTELDVARDRVKTLKERMGIS